MANRLSPVPPAGRSKIEKQTTPDGRPEANPNKRDERPQNLKEQGQPGNIAQNTTNQGLQKDR